VVVHGGQCVNECLFTFGGGEGNQKIFEDYAKNTTNKCFMVIIHFSFILFLEVKTVPFLF
jgi:hypothetical protein